ncbi:MAG: beta-L-arabinofuranosidase domain-containing protein, partial [Planctomycetota bacterium]
GASYSLSVHPDAKLEKYLDELIVKIAAAQEEDGYLFTCRTNKSQKLINWYGKERWSKLGGSHELYNMGHLYEAAVAHYQATGKRSLLDVVIKNADFLDKVFGPGKNETAPGHQIIEMGLARLYRATGNEKYLKLAKFYLDTRGPGGNAYHQSHQKVVEQSEAVGHAVRASYMYCGMADVAALTGDVSYRRAANRIWENVVSKKLYLTGGIGATGSGEAFGKNYQLPNETAYCETCAAIGNVMWNHRMFLFDGEAKYIDVLERTLYNALISGVSLSGDSFFYPNPLESRGQHKRSPWFGCACCPGNITRFIASVPGYIYAQQGKTLYVNLFVNGSAAIKMGKNTVRIKQQTRYPWDGKVKIQVSPERSAEFTIAIRMPGWARNEAVPSDLYQYLSRSDEDPVFRVSGGTAKVGTHKGYASLTRTWKKGDVIDIILPMPVRRVLSHEKVEGNAGKVAIQRGPIVYCAEWLDNDSHVLDFILADDVKLTTEHRNDLLNGVTVVRGKAVGLSYDEDGKSMVKKARDFTAIPYYAWAHRGPGEMAVWLARDESTAKPLTPPGMISNPSFEKAINNRPTNWERGTYNGRGEFKYVKGGRTGKRAVCLSSEDGADIGWLTSVAVKPRSRYKLTGWIKTENLDAGSGKGALFNLHNLQPVQTKAVTGTKDWTRVEVVFDTGDRAAVEINCLFGGWGLSTGKAWYDDISLVAVSDKPQMLYGDDSYGSPFAKDPDVVRFKGKYYMYYSMRRPSTGFAVGIAQSDDLVKWAKAGEIVPKDDYEKKGIAAPAAIVLAGEVHLFYQTYGNGARDAICHAVSTDGINFTRDKTNPVFSPTGAWNCGRAIDADVIEHDGKLLLYWATRDPGYRVQMVGVSSAAIDSDYGRDKWKQLCDAPILKPKLPWEKRCIEAPAVVKHGDKLFMFYAGAYNNEPQQIGCAVSDDGISWKRISDYPLLPNGREGQWNWSESGHPGVFVDDDGKMYLFFQGNNDRGKTWYLSKMLIGWADNEPYLIRPRDKEEFHLRKTIQSKVTIDAAKTSEPISKYIYGQFIEHLGRCIYGGIWAEMLEDRKFYFPVTANFDPYRAPSGVSKDNPFAIVKASPWQIIGPADSVTMVKEDSFVGEHTPLIQPEAGIRQRDLGLVKGKRYVGYIWLKPSGKTTTVEVALRRGDDLGRAGSHVITSSANRYRKHTLRFVSPADTHQGTFEIKVLSGGPCLVGTASLMPADNVEGMRADTLKLLKELNAPMYRWPGGNFVSGYDWRDGIGDRDKRPPRTNPAWTGVEHNDFGFNEFIRFCRLVGAEPLVTVNTGFGDAYSAAAQLEYSNGSTDTLMGSLRAKNGELEPFNVRYWCIGNEMFGNWQLGYMRLGHYVLKHNWVVDKMREVDPDIVTIASGNAGSWSEGLLRNCSNHIDMIAEHFYCQERSNLLEHTSQIPDNIKRKVQFHEQLREKLDTLKGKDIQVAMTEWNYWYGPHLFGELGTRYFHKDGLGIAKGLHEYFRHSDMIFMANYAQTVNVIGCIKTTKTDAAFETTGLTLKLYRQRFGTLPVAVTADAYPLDVAAAWTSNRKVLTVAVVNPTEQKYEFPIELKGAELAGNGRLSLIAHSDPMAYNEPGKPPQVVIEEKLIQGISNKLSMPPLSISLYELSAR